VHQEGSGEHSVVTGGNGDGSGGRSGDGSGDGNLVAPALSRTKKLTTT